METCVCVVPSRTQTVQAARVHFSSMRKLPVSEYSWPASPPASTAIPRAPSSINVYRFRGCGHFAENEDNDTHIAARHAHQPHKTLTTQHNTAERPTDEAAGQQKNIPREHASTIISISIVLSPVHPQSCVHDSQHMRRQQNEPPLHEPWSAQAHARVRRMV